MTSLIEKFEVLNRWTNAVQFTAEISVTPGMSPRIKLGLAVRWGRDSGADLRGANLSGASLHGANLSFANLSGANLSGASLHGANLSFANLSGANLSGADLRDVNLRDASLHGANLRGASLHGANLSFANLSGANLSGANLSFANLSGAPKIKNIHQRVYQAASQPGALDMGHWHTCETTHCRAGWVVALAGAEGRTLESKMGTSAAATLIYLASDPSLDKVPDFYCSNDEALEDMRRLAEAEQEQQP